MVTLLKAVPTSTPPTGPQNTSQHFILLRGVYQLNLHKHQASPPATPACQRSKIKLEAHLGSPTCLRTAACPLHRWILTSFPMKCRLVLLGPQQRQGPNFGHTLRLHKVIRWRTWHNSLSYEKHWGKKRKSTRLSRTAPGLF